MISHVIFVTAFYGVIEEHTTSHAIFPSPFCVVIGGHAHDITNNFCYPFLWCKRKAYHIKHNFCYPLKGVLKMECLLEYKTTSRNFLCVFGGCFVR